MIVDILTADKPTTSRKIYPAHILQAQINKLQDIIDRRGFLGELGPITSILHDASIKLANASHIVNDLWITQDNILRAEVEILQTPSGRVLQHLIDSQVKVYFSLVGVGGGKVNDNGDLVIGDSYRLIQIEAWAENSRPQHLLIQEKPKRYRSIDDEWITE